ncbi:hypothetical protein JW823_09215 [bacterium]|nr:hypothetical protein [candidate division CSSED10-310 bacterium]
MYSIALQATIIAAGVNLFLTIYVLLKHRGWNRALNRYFAVLSFAFALWNLGIAVDSSSLIYIGMFMVPPAFYTFLQTLLRQFDSRERLFSALLIVLSIALIISSTWVFRQPVVIPMVRNTFNALAFCFSAPVFFWGTWRLSNRAKLTRSNRERFRLIFVLIGMTAAAVAGVTAGLAVLGFRLQSWSAVAGLFYTISITIAIMRHRLFDIGRLAARLIVILILALVLWFLFGILGHFQIEEKTISFLSILVGSLVLVMLYEPLKVLVEGQTYRVLSPDAGHFLDNLDSFGRQMNSFLDEGMIIREFAANLRNSRRIQSFAIYTADPTGENLIIQEGDDIRWPVGSYIPFPKLLISTMISQRGPVSRNQLGIELRGGLPKSLHENSLQLYRILNRFRATEVFPFLFGETFFGFLAIGLEDPETDLTRSEEDMLSGITRQFAAALAHIRLEKQNHAREHLVALGRLASGLAHEIRNPLATIKASVQYLEPESTGSDHTEFFAIIQQEVDRLDRFVRRFLEYARPATQQADVPMQPLESVFSQFLRGFKTRPECTGIQIDFSCDEPVGRLLIPIDVWNQILGNLICNAVSAITGGGIIRVCARIPEDLSRFEIAIEDSGSGIPEQERQMVFEPFFTRREGGTGLGLAIVRRLVRGMGGEIVCGESRLGGAGFFIRIPIDKSDE